MIDPLLKKLKTYYNKVKNPTYILDEWVIANDELYNKYKNKLIISNINSIMGDESQYIAICETKNKYIAIKYNSNFVCLREADNEYGLVMDDYDLLAIKKEILYSKETLLSGTTKDITLNQLAKSFSWKLSKITKKNLEDFN